MDLVVKAGGHARWGERSMRCTVGRSGITAAKREGDGATPAGLWPMRRILYRPDRLTMPPSRLAATAILEDDGWCDGAADPLYNRPVKLPYAGRHERLWRAEPLYDLIVVLGHNDDPVVPGAGSAIFLHRARADWGPTEGCVALALSDLLLVAAEASAGDRVLVLPSPTPSPAEG